MAIKKVKAPEAGKMRGATDWRKVKSMTDEEISQSTKLDPNARELRQDELMQFKRVKNIRK